MNEVYIVIEKSRNLLQHDLSKQTMQEGTMDNDMEVVVAVRSSKSTAGVRTTYGGSMMSFF